jgi:hypothetical protein
MVTALLVVVLLVSQGQAPSPALPPGFIEIDGAKNPELLPEHLVWSSGFRMLAVMKEHQVRLGEKFLTHLTLSEPDAELLFAEVARFVARSDRCHAAGARLVTALPGEQHLAELERAMQANTLACRTVMLDSKDRLLVSMTPEGQTTLITWMLAERAKIKTILPKSDLEFFRQPR